MESAESDGSICDENFSEDESFLSNFDTSINRDENSVNGKTSEIESTEIESTPPTVISCDFCGFNFTKKLHFALHFKNCSRDLKFECYICDKIHSNAENELLHYFVHHRGYVDVIDELINSDEDFNDQLAKIDKDILASKMSVRNVIVSLGKKAQKPKIDKYFSAQRKRVLKKVRRIHKKTDPSDPNAAKHFDCDICQKRFTLFSNYKIHEDFCNKETSQNGFKCRLCGKETKYINYILRHYKIYHSEYVDKLLNPKGDHSGDSSDQKVAENTKETPKVERIACRKLCEHCKVSFNKRLHYEIHLQSCLLRTDKTKPALKCHLCLKRVTTPSTLLSHYKIIHPDYVKVCNERLEEREKSLLKCQICQKQMKNSTFLKYHYKNVHAEHDASKFGIRDKQADKIALEKEKSRFFCENCKVEFGKELNFKIHEQACLMNAFNKDISYCHLCQKVLKSTKGFIQHYKKAHQDYIKCLEMDMQPEAFSNSDFSQESYSQADVKAENQDISEHPDEDYEENPQNYQENIEETEGYEEQGDMEYPQDFPMTSEYYQEGEEGYDMEYDNSEISAEHYQDNMEYYANEGQGVPIKIESSESIPEENYSHESHNNYY